jgi:hypothetical protein
MSDRTLNASKLQLKAAEERSLGNWATAERALREAIPLLRAELDDREAIFPTGSDATKAVAAQLADCWGSLGGILRRLGNDAAALESYRQGKDLEMNEAYQIESTYNRIQWIVLRVLANPDVLHDPKEQRFTSELAALQRRKASDAWAWADVLLLAILSDNNPLAIEAFNAIDTASTIDDVYKSGLPVLERLASVVPDHEGLQRAIRKYKAKVAAAQN